MKKLGIVLSFIALLATIPAAALEGTLINSDFESAALGGEVKNYQIYLPPGYESSGASYPVVYFLHGEDGCRDLNPVLKIHSLQCCRLHYSRHRKIHTYQMILMKIDTYL